MSFLFENSQINFASCHVLGHCAPKIRHVALQTIGVLCSYLDNKALLKIWNELPQLGAVKKSITSFRKRLRASVNTGG